MLKKRQQWSNNYISSIKLLSNNSLSLIVGQLMVLLLFFVITIPLLSKIYHLSLSVTGYSYITIDNLLRFLLHPINLLMLVLIFFYIGLFLLLEIYYILTFYTMINQKKKINVIPVVAIALYKTVFGLWKGNIKLIPFAWMSVLLFNIPFFVFYFNKSRLVRFMAAEVPNNIILLLTVLIVIGLLYMIFIRRGFLFHHFLHRGMRYKEAVELSKDSKSNRPVVTFLYFFFWNILLFLILAALYAFTMAVTILIVSGTFNRELSIATFISVNESMSAYLYTAVFSICTMWNFALYTRLFYSYQLVPGNEVPDALSEITLLAENTVKKKSVKRTLITTALIIIVVSLGFFINILRNGSPLSYMNLEDIQVTSHRGFSHDVPENTLPAIEKAIEEQADYIEIDVRMTKDGELVLLHDNNLMRTTGVNENVDGLNYAEVALLDAGSWMGPQYAGTRIPTLREAFDTCKGRVLLNLDLKYQGPDTGIEEKVVELINEYDMKWQCVISSNHLSTLEKVKELDPDIQTGYISYQLDYDLLKDDNVDFFSMKSKLINKNILQSIHRNGKKLYAWTVNSKAEMERLKRLGVDNIITDDPVYAKEVLFQSDNDWLVMTLFRMIME